MLENELLSQERLAICEKCPLYKNDKLYGAVCDSNKFISQDGTKWSWFRKEGYVRGCGCHLKQKSKKPNSHCIIKLW